jgi:nucleotide-binding universal stress UspA family protein
MTDAASRRRLDSSGTVRCEMEPVPIGQPAHILLEEAANADLLVVGSRGLGGFRGLLLGSVSQQCAQHCPCPITILPRETD